MVTCIDALTSDNGLRILANQQYILREILKLGIAESSHHVYTSLYCLIEMNKNEYQTSAREWDLLKSFLPTNQFDMEYSRCRINGMSMIDSLCSAYPLFRELIETTIRYISNLVYFYTVSGRLMQNEINDIHDMGIHLELITSHGRILGEGFCNLYRFPPERCIGYIPTGSYGQLRQLSASIKIK